MTVSKRAEYFASYDGSNRFAPNAEGTTFVHTFEVAGTDEYISVPPSTSTWSAR